MDWKTVAVYGLIIVAAAALLYPKGMAAKAVASVGDAISGTLRGTSTLVTGG